MQIKAKVNKTQQKKNKFSCIRDQHYGYRLTYGKRRRPEGRGMMHLKCQKEDDPMWKQGNIKRNEVHKEYMR